MKRLFSFALLAAALTCSLLAQAPGGGFPGITAPAAIDPTTGLPIPPPKMDTGPKFDINFSGGNPAQLLEVIEKTAGERPNAVIHPECAKLDLPPFRLRSVSAYQVFMTLNTLNQSMSDSGFWQRVPMEEGEVWTLLPQNKSPGPGAQLPPSGQPSAKRQNNCQVFNLSPYLDKYTVEDLTTAIQGAWDLMQLEENPAIKYHKDTKLLIVVGSIPSLRVVADVLRQLEPNLDPKQKAEKAPTTDSNKDSKPTSKF